MQMIIGQSNIAYIRYTLTIPLLDKKIKNNHDQS